MGGGLAGDETPEQRNATLDVTVPLLDGDPRPRYLMGLGSPLDLRDFPLDSQPLLWRLRSSHYPLSVVRLQPYTKTVFCVSRLSWKLVVVELQGQGARAEAD